MTGDYDVQVRQQLAQARTALAAAEAERDGARERLDFAHCNTIPDLQRQAEHHQAGKQRWRARAERAEARIAAVRALHYGEGSKWDDGGLQCFICREPNWPCSTLAALDGPAAPEFAPTTVPEPAPAPTLAAMYKLAEAAGAAHQQSARLLEEWIYQRAVSIGLTVHRSASGVQQIAGHPTAIDQLSAVLAPAARAELFGPIGSYTGLPVIPDEALPPGEIHLRPHPRPADGPS